jgi:hypothetical protein
VPPGRSPSQTAVTGTGRPRPGWRRRPALGWLRADLAGRAERLENSGPQGRKEVQAVLGYWQGDLALAGVRDAAAVARLPAEERAAWQRFWAEVEALRAKARDRK